MADRSIRLYPHEVRATLAGTMTQTRRVLKPQITVDEKGVATWEGSAQRMWCGSPSDTNFFALAFNPYGLPGERLWVRETFGHFERNDTLKPGDTIYYRADGEAPAIEPWRPSIHMPRWASRITLEITGVRVERLQDISEADSIAEGIECIGGRFTFNGGLHESRTAVESYRALWNSINGRGTWDADPWDANPWLWVLEFRRVEVSHG